MTEPVVPTLTLPAPVVDALLEGEVVIDLRLQPDAGGPPAGATRFWLRADPGAQPELKPAYLAARRLSLPDEGAGPGRVRIDGWAELRGTATVVVDADTAEGLNGKTILALGPLADREVLVLALRAHRLVEPVTVPDDLAGLPADAADGPPSQPCLSEAAFDARRRGVENALPTPLKPPG